MNPLDPFSAFQQIFEKAVKQGTGTSTGDAGWWNNSSPQDIPRPKEPVTRLAHKSEFDRSKTILARALRALDQYETAYAKENESKVSSGEASFSEEKRASMHADLLYWRKEKQRLIELCEALAPVVIYPKRPSCHETK
jgi:hypothetical protein